MIHGDLVMLVKSQLAAQRDGTRRLGIVKCLGLEAVEWQERDAARHLALIHNRENLRGCGIRVDHNVKEGVAG